MTLLGPELVRRKVKVSIERGGSLPPVLGDMVQVQQVLVNLLMNGAEAMEGMEPGERRLEVRTRAEGKDRVLVDVTDRGAGMDEEARRRLFEPFFTTKPGGLGMGLAICRSIVEAHGGQIRAVRGRDPRYHAGVLAPGASRLRAPRPRKICALAPGPGPWINAKSVESPSRHDSCTSAGRGRCP